MPIDQAMPSEFQPDGVEIGHIQFDVAVASNATVVVGVASTDKVGGLHIGQRERCMAMPWVRLDGLVVAGQVGDQRVLVGAHLCLAFIRQGAAWRAKAQLAIFGPKQDAESFEFGDKCDGIHSVPSSKAVLTTAGSDCSFCARSKAAWAATVGAENTFRNDRPPPAGPRWRSASISRVARRLSPPS